MPDGAQDAAWAAAMITEAIGAFRIDACAVGGPRAPAAMAGEPLPIVHPSARLAVTLTGSYRRRISCGGRRTELPGGPGTGVFLAAQAWDLRLVGEPFTCLGLVFAPGYLRVLEGRHHGGRRSLPAPRWHHTATPLSGAGAQTVAALGHRAEAGAEAGAAEAHLLIALLHLARQHCLADRPARSRGETAWQAMREWLHEHAHEDLGRDAVAARFGLHPTYFSELCVRHGGEGFHRLLEGLRLERARSLLAAGDATVAEIAAACGFGDAGTCIRAFRRRLGTTPQRWRSARTMSFDGRLSQIDQ